MITQFLNLKELKYKPVRTESVTNLRRDHYRPQVWRRVGMPQKVSDLDALPDSTHTMADGTRLTLLLGANNELYFNALRDGRAVANTQYLGTLEASPIQVLSKGNVVKVWLRHAPTCYIAWDEMRRSARLLHLSSKASESIESQLPVIEFGVGDYHTIQQTVEGAKLSGASNPASGSQLIDHDLNIVGQLLTSAYTHAKEHARVQLRHIQPVLARYRITDIFGETLCVGAPQFMSPAGGYALTEGVILYSTDSLATLSGGTMAVPTYRLTAKIDRTIPTSLLPVIGEILVETTAEIDPVNPKGSVGHAIKRDAGTGTVTVTAHLPGVANGNVVDTYRLQQLTAAAVTLPLYSKPFEDPNRTGTMPYERLWCDLSTPPTLSQHYRTAATVTYGAALHLPNFQLFADPHEDDGTHLGHLLLFDHGDLGQTLDTLRVASGTTAALRQAPNSANGWNFANAKVLVFGSSGIHIVSINRKATFHSTAHIDSRAVLAPSAVTASPSKYKSLLFAIAGRDIVAVSGQKVTTVTANIADHIPSPSAIGYCMTYNELYVANPPGALIRMTSSGDIINTLLPGVAGSLRLGGATPLCIAGKGGVWNLDREEHENKQALPVLLRQRIALEETPEVAAFHLSTREIRGYVHLLGDRGTEEPERLLRLELDGAVNAPVTARVAIPWRRYLTVIHEGEAASDLSIDPLSLYRFNRK